MMTERKQTDDGDKATLHNTDRPSETLKTGLPTVGEGAAGRGYVESGEIEKKSDEDA